MSVVAAAIVTTGVVSAYSASQSAEASAEAAEAGADAAAYAQIRSTELQVDEMRRQFDYQMNIIQPQLEQQMQAQRAYSDLLGISPGARQRVLQEQRGDYVPGSTLRALEDKQRLIGSLRRQMNQVGRNTPEGRSLQRQINEVALRPVEGEYTGMRGGRPVGDPNQAIARGDMLAGRTGIAAGAPVPGAPAGATYFTDPNIDPTRLADISRVGDAIYENRLAGTAVEDDPYRQYVEQTSLAADTLQEDVLRGDIESRLLAEGAAGTGVYGDVFQESPGYAFQVEEMERQLERTRSAGGPNIGGRAVMEAQRRAQGLTAQDYYNWAAGRERDLGRLGQAEAMDASRLDAAGRDFRAMQLSEQARGDQAYQDYMRRQEIDAGRAIEGAQYADRLEAVDRERTDQAYYNYLNALQAQAGFGGGPAAQAVSASQAVGAGVAGAYGQQGQGLSNIFQQQGNIQAQIAANEYAGINQAFQGTAQNLMTYNYMQQPQAYNPTHTGPPPGGWTPATTGPR